MRPHLMDAAASWGQACYKLGAEDPVSKETREEARVSWLLFQALVEASCRALDGNTRLIDQALIESVRPVEFDGL